MEKNKMHKLDLILMVGMGIIAIFSALIDALYIKVFPVCSCASIYASYALWIILLIYSSIKYKEKQEKPKYFEWFMFFGLPFFHIAFAVVGMIGVRMLIGLLLNL